MWDKEEIDSSLRAYVVSKVQYSEELLRATDCDDVRSVSQICKDFDVSRVTSLLLYASWKEAFRVVAFLLEQGADPNAGDNMGRTSLHFAAISGNYSVTEALLNKNAVVDTFDKNNVATPLFCAAMSNDPDVLKLLLKRGANINAGLHDHGVSALHCAVRANNITNIQLLLELGAIPNNVQLFSETPLHTAASMGYNECVKLLIDHGACLEVLMGVMKMTALHLAAQDGNTEAVRHLLNGGANIDARNARGQSSLHLAVSGQSLETAELLLESGSVCST